MIIILIFVRLLLVSCQVSSVSLIPAYSDIPIQIYQNNEISSNFTIIKKNFNCSEPSIFIYNQNATQYKLDISYQMNIITDSEVNITITPQLGNINPYLNQSSCSSSCNISITNNCSTKLTNSNYYDDVIITISSIPSFEYKINCDSRQIAIFQWGMFLLITLCIFIIFATSIYSVARSLGGIGIQINIWLIIIFDLLLLIGILIGVFASVQILNMILEVIMWILGPLCIGFCINQILWLLKIDVLNRRYFFIVRGIDIISFIIGLALTFSWWFAYKNWILNDIISISIIITFIKIFKFTSLKMSLIGIGTMIFIEIIGVIIIYSQGGGSYNNFIINQVNNPLLIQIPTITKNLNTKCSWLPLNEIIFPALVISFLRRFDNSRNTYIYLIISDLAFYMGSIIWMLVSTSVPFQLPFSLFSETVLFLAIILFAYQRNEFKVIWEGSFFDQQFLNRYTKLITLEKNSKEQQINSIDLNKSVIEDLKL